MTKSKPADALRPAPAPAATGPAAGAPMDRRWRTAVENSRPITSRASPVRLSLAPQIPGIDGAAAGEGDMGGMIKEIMAALARGPIRIEFDASIAQGREDEWAGRIFGLEFCTGGRVASIQWTAAAEPLLVGCHLRNVQPLLTFTIGEAGVSAALALPQPTT